MSTQKTTLPCSIKTEFEGLSKSTPKQGFYLKHAQSVEQHLKMELPKDTVPMSLKPYFWTGESAPHLLKDYDVIGFDVDHTFVKYNVETT